MVIFPEIPGMARDHQDDITHDGSMYAIYLPTCKAVDF